MIDMAIPKGARVTGPEREKLSTQITAEYEKGKSIRAIAEKHGRSYGSVHRILSESPSVTFRQRGGAARAKSKTRARTK